MEKVYAAIDLKSFYASVECAERKLNPLTTNLVVTDIARTEKTICLAVSPSLKSYKINGRARLFEVIKKVNEINSERRKKIGYKKFTGTSYDDTELKKNEYLKLDYIVAKPRMSLYMKYSSDIYSVYLKYLSPDDIFVYSIDEIFCDLTPYLKTYNLSAKGLVTKMMRDVYKTTGITGAAGIGPNLFLAKVAMDIEAKHVHGDICGVRIAYLDEISYRKKLWNHRPLTSFWRIGNGYAKKLEENNIYTMGDIARTSINNEELLYKLFGVNAEILIDHALGYEPCTIKDIKSYKPQNRCISTGQVLSSSYDYIKAKLIVTEMMDNLSLDLVSKNMTTNLIVLNISYDNKCLNDDYNGKIKKDYYGRLAPKDCHGTIKVNHYTSSTKILTSYILKLYDDIINKNLLIKRINITACNLKNKEELQNELIVNQLNLFYNNDLKNIKEVEKEENKIQKTIINIKNKYGKNSIIKLMDLQDGATSVERNNQIGGHNK